MAFTYFFRDMQTLETVRDYAIPSLRTRRYINVWDAGCAMGPEPYSLAIILRENMGRMIFRNVRIFATDIDTCDLFGKIISEGVYPREQVQRIPEDIFSRYFVGADMADSFRLIDEICQCVRFQKHDLLSLKPIAREFGLVVCKNVLLHFQYEERIRVIRMFHDVLIEGGFLVTEQTQKMPPEFDGMFEQVTPNAQLFRKVG